MLGVILFIVAAVLGYVDAFLRQSLLSAAVGTLALAHVVGSL